MGYGAGSELGPLLVNSNGTGLEFNKFAWNKGLLLSLFSAILEWWRVTSSGHITKAAASKIEPQGAHHTLLFLICWPSRLTSEWVLVLSVGSMYRGSFEGSVGLVLTKESRQNVLFSPNKTCGKIFLFSPSNKIYGKFFLLKKNSQSCCLSMFYKNFTAFSFKSQLISVLIFSTLACSSVFSHLMPCAP